MNIINLIDIELHAQEYQRFFLVKKWESDLSKLKTAENVENQLQAKHWKSKNGHIVKKNVSLVLNAWKIWKLYQRIPEMINSFAKDATEKSLYQNAQYAMIIFLR